MYVLPTVQGHLMTSKRPHIACDGKRPHIASDHCDLVRVYAFKILTSATVFLLVRTQSSPFEAWSGSVYGHTCYAYCQKVLPCLFLPFQSIHLHFFQNLSEFFPVLACRIKLVTLLDVGSRVECPRHTNRLQKHDLWKDDDL